MSHAKDRLFNDWKTKEVAYRAYVARELATYSGMRRRQRGFIINPFAFGAAATDPYFANVKLLLHMDGANNASTFTDHSSAARTMTASNAVTSTSVYKYGTASGYGSVSGTSNLYVTTADTADLELAAQDFCLESWVYYDSTVANGAWSPVISDKTAASNLEHRFGIIGAAAGAAAMNFYYSTTGADFPNFTGASFTPGTGTWAHCACSLDGNNFKFWRNGTQSGTTQTLSSTIFAGTAAWRCFSPGTSTLTFTGRLDDLRITVGVPRYTADFTAPTAAHPNS